VEELEPLPYEIPLMKTQTYMGIQHLKSEVKNGTKKGKNLDSIPEIKNKKKSKEKLYRDNQEEEQNLNISRQREGSVEHDEFSNMAQNEEADNDNEAHGGDD
jgi:hypothetical protein